MKGQSVAHALMHFVFCLLQSSQMCQSIIFKGKLSSVAAAGQSPGRGAFCALVWVVVGVARGVNHKPCTYLPLCFVTSRL